MYSGGIYILCMEYVHGVYINIYGICIITPVRMESFVDYLHAGLRPLMRHRINRYIYIYLMLT